MNELKFNVVQSIGEITANFDEFKNQVSQELEKYKSKEFTEDTKKDAKKDLAELRKKKAAVNERRIEVKKEYMKPYDEFEAKVKELITLIDEPITLIDYKVKEFEEKLWCLFRKEGCLMEIGEKLSKLQQDMKVPKDQYNKFGKFYYRNAETILAEFKKYEKDLKVFLTLKDEIVEVVGKVYIKATATLVDCESDEEISVTAYARESEEKKGMDEAQITGSVSSYARKYALNGLFLLDDVKDPDSDEYEKQKNQDKSDQKDGKSTSSNIKINQNHINSLRSLFTENGIDESKVLVLYKVQKIEALTINQYKNAFDHVKELKESCSV